MAKKMREVIISYILPILLLLLLAVEAHAHNVTLLLAKHPSFSSFNHYLTQTHLADEINRRNPVTVCAVENSAMSALTSKGYKISTLRNILSLHVLLDYFDAKKLHQLRGGSTLAPTLLQATRAAPGTTGFVNITDLIGVKVGGVGVGVGVGVGSGFVNLTDLIGGKVGFGPEDSGIISFYVKSVEAVPYTISIIQISNILLSV